MGSGGGAASAAESRIAAITGIIPGSFSRTKPPHTPSSGTAPGGGGVKLLRRAPVDDAKDGEDAAMLSSEPTMPRLLPQQQLQPAPSTWAGSGGGTGEPDFTHHSSGGLDCYTILEEYSDPDDYDDDEDDDDDADNDMAGDNGNFNLRRANFLEFGGSDDSDSDETAAASAAGAGATSTSCYPSDTAGVCLHAASTSTSISAHIPFADDMSAFKWSRMEPLPPQFTAHAGVRRAWATARNGKSSPPLHAPQQKVQLSLGAAVVQLAGRVSPLGRATWRYIQQEFSQHCNARGDDDTASQVEVAMVSDIVGGGGSSNDTDESDSEQRTQKRAASAALQQQQLPSARLVAPMVLRALRVALTLRKLRNSVVAAGAAAAAASTGQLQLGTAGAGGDGGSFSSSRPPNFNLSGRESSSGALAEIDDIGNQLLMSLSLNDNAVSGQLQHRDRDDSAGAAPRRNRPWGADQTPTSIQGFSPSPFAAGGGNSSSTSFSAGFGGGGGNNSASSSSFSASSSSSNGGGGGNRGSGLSTSSASRIDRSSPHSSSSSRFSVDGGGGGVPLDALACARLFRSLHEWTPGRVYTETSFLAFLSELSAWYSRYRADAEAWMEDASEWSEDAEAMLKLDHSVVVHPTSTSSAAGPAHPSTTSTFSGSGYTMVGGRLVPSAISEASDAQVEVSSAVGGPYTGSMAPLFVGRSGSSSSSALAGAASTAVDPYKPPSHLSTSTSSSAYDLHKLHMSELFNVLLPEARKSGKSMADVSITSRGELHRLTAQSNENLLLQLVLGMVSTTAITATAVSDTPVGAEYSHRAQNTSRIPHPSAVMDVLVANLLDILRGPPPQNVNVDARGPNFNVSSAPPGAAANFNLPPAPLVSAALHCLHSLALGVTLIIGDDSGEVEVRAVSVGDDLLRTRSVRALLRTPGVLSSLPALQSAGTLRLRSIAYGTLTRLLFLHARAITAPAAPLTSTSSAAAAAAMSLSSGAPTSTSDADGVRPPTSTSFVGYGDPSSIWETDAEHATLDNAARDAFVFSSASDEASAASGNGGGTSNGGGGGGAGVWFTAFTAQISAAAGSLRSALGMLSAADERAVKLKMGAPCRSLSELQLACGTYAQSPPLSHLSRLPPALQWEAIAWARDVRGVLSASSSPDEFKLCHDWLTEIGAWVCDLFSSLCVRALSVLRSAFYSATHCCYTSRR